MSKDKDVQRLYEIQKLAPSLTFQNNGYEYSTPSDEDVQYHIEVEEILRRHIGGFDKFNNFKIINDGSIMVRYQLNYNFGTDGLTFIGVAYTPIDYFTNEQTND